MDIDSLLGSLKCLVSSPIMGLLTGIGHPPQRGGIYALLAQFRTYGSKNG
jgi:hypothetical protein